MSRRPLFVFVDLKGNRHEIFDDYFAGMKPFLFKEIRETFHEMASEIAERWRKMDIRVAAFDFGCTITQMHWEKLFRKLPASIPKQEKKHLTHKWGHEAMYKYPEIVRPLLIGNFNMWLLGVLFDELQKAGIEPVIVSYGNRDVEWALLRPIFSALSGTNGRFGAKTRIFTQRVGAIWDNCAQAEGQCSLFRSVYTDYDALYNDKNPDIHQENFAQDMKRLIPSLASGHTIADYHESQEEIPKKSTLMRAALCMFGSGQTTNANAILIDNNEKNIQDMNENEFSSFYVGPSTCDRPRGFLDVFLQMRMNE